MKKSTLKAILACVTVVILIAAGIVVASTLERKSEKAPEGAGTAVSTVRGEESEEEAPDYDAEARVAVNINGRDYYLRENISTLLVMGTDDMEVEESTAARNGALADFLVVAILDSEAKTCTLLQINRNTMADMMTFNSKGDFMGMKNQQICYAHTYGDGLQESCENQVDAVSRLLYGVHIDNYLAMAMGGIVPLNDAVGGVTVTIEDDFTGADDTLIQGETVTLMGEHAFHFVHDRFQMINKDNEARMRRQATYMTALAAKVREKTEEDATFILNVLDAVDEYLVTDCDINELSEYSQSLVDYTLDEIVTPEGENGHGRYVEFYPDEEKLQQLVIDLFYVPADEVDGVVIDPPEEAYDTPAPAETADAAVTDAPAEANAVPEEADDVPEEPAEAGGTVPDS